MSPPSPPGASKTPASRSGGEAGDQGKLRPSNPDSDHLAGEHVARPDARTGSLRPRGVLLLDDAADHPLTVERKRHQQEQRPYATNVAASPASSSGPERAVLSSGAGGRRWRSTHGLVSATAAAFGRPRTETEPVLGQEQHASTSRSSTARRPTAGDDAKLDLRVVERVRRPLEGGGSPGGAGATTAGRSPRPSPSRRAAKSRQRKDDDRSTRGTPCCAAALAARAATSMIALRPAHGATSSKKLGQRRRAVAERDDLRRPLRRRKHALRVHVSIRQQPQVPLRRSTSSIPADPAATRRAHPRS